jgi:hypothetical protein
MSVGMTGFLDYDHRPVFKIIENTTFRKLDLFPSSGEGKEAPALLGPLEELISVIIMTIIRLEEGVRPVPPSWQVIYMLSISVTQPDITVA